MDLLRRRGAGELAELFGPLALPADRASRLHRFRHRAVQQIDKLPVEDRDLLAAYGDGVNSGLTSLAEKPFEYLLLRSEPVAWRTEDSLLAVFGMYFVLNDSRGARESDIGLIHDVLPEELAGFLAPMGSEWDAPVVGEPFETLPIPDAGTLIGEPKAAANDRVAGDAIAARALVGSNNWAVAGSRTADGRAILADDMHLGMAVPNTWYRVTLEWPGGDGCRNPHRMIGVTLPGSPAVVAGSNTRVAWGFTNSQGDWSDLVILEVEEGDPDRYRTRSGWTTVERSSETISVRGGARETIEIRQTIWGPIVDRDHQDRQRAIRWIAHDAGSVNLGMTRLEHAATVEDAIEAATVTGIPPQNFVCADDRGSIGWTIIGKIPRRFGHSGRVPSSWADGSRGWDGWLQPEEYPRVIDPADGIIWTANARVVGGDMLKTIGHGGYDLGARAQQIRDGLLALENADESDMLALQLDDRAVFLTRWREYLLGLLDEKAVAEDHERLEFRDLVESTWTGHASVDSISYRLVRAFRTFAFERIYGSLTARCEELDEGFNIYRIQQAEGPLWRLVTEQPTHLLDGGVSSWRDLLLDVVDSTIEYYRTEIGGQLSDHTWGNRNTLSMRHPLSGAIPALSRWLDMPRVALPGDNNMPRVQSPGWGASERFAVSPGREDEGYFHMPAGQSGHFLSPYYRAGHTDWVDGRQTPFLPGPTDTILTMLPASR
jgi:penicillin amidase